MINNNSNSKSDNEVIIPQDSYWAELCQVIGKTIWIKMVRFIMLFFIFSCLPSCSTSYYLCETESETPLYYKKSVLENKIMLIPKGAEVVSRGKSKYRKVKYNDTIGWAYTPSFKNVRAYNYKGDFKVYKKHRKTKHYSSNTGGTIHVKGYYRKNGTYVRPHTRRK